MILNFEIKCTSFRNLLEATLQRSFMEGFEEYFSELMSLYNVSEILLLPTCSAH